MLPSFHAEESAAFTGLVHPNVSDDIWLCINCVNVLILFHLTNVKLPIPVSPELLKSLIMKSLVFGTEQAVTL